MNLSKQPIVIKRSGKQDRAYKVLLGMVEYYLKTGRPVGSNTLKEAGFEDLSSATIRNYFNLLEQQGYLSQQHASGGRIPTYLAYKIYAEEYLHSQCITNEEEKVLQKIRLEETREIASFLQKSAEILSELTKSAVFLSAPRFDHDYIVGIKLVPIDHQRCLCVIVTDFGIVKTELLHIENRINTFLAKKLESYFHWRLTGQAKPEHFNHEEEKLAQAIYNELIIRYVVSYSNFVDAELYRTGFSNLLAYPDFHETSILATTLALFENTHSMRLLIKECLKLNQLKFWIGDDFLNFTTSTPNCAVLAIPYYINQKIAGAVGILGPARIPYKELIATLRAFSENISEALTRNLYKFKITFRQPHSGTSKLADEEHRLVDQSRLILLENKNP